MITFEVDNFVIDIVHVFSFKKKSQKNILFKFHFPQQMNFEPAIVVKNIVIV